MTEVVPWYKLFGSINSEETCDYEKRSLKLKNVSDRSFGSGELMEG